MNETDIIARINAALTEEFEIEAEDLVPGATFKEDLGLDSLDAVDMVVVLEQEFGIKIKKDEAFKSIKTLGDLYGFVLEKKRVLAA